MNTSTICVVLLLVGFVEPIRAEVVVLPSIGTLTARSDVICRGKVTTVETKKVKPGIVVETVRLRVTEVIEGCRVGEEVSFAYFVTETSPSGRAWLLSKNSVLFLLRHTLPDEKRLKAKLTPVMTHPAFTVIEPGGKDLKFFITHQYDVVKDGEKIVLEVLESSRRKNDYRRSYNRSKSIPTVKVEVPADSSAYKALYADSAVYLIVPRYMLKGGVK